jgi:hypothetical protein
LSSGVTIRRAAGHARVAEMNKQVAANLGKIITALEPDGPGEGKEAVAGASLRRRPACRSCGPRS